MCLPFFECAAHQLAHSKCDKRSDTHSFLGAETDVDCSYPHGVITCILIHGCLFSICIYNAAVKSVVTRESEISAQLTLPAPHQGKWKQTLQRSQSHGKNDLALWLKCFLSSPFWSVTSIDQSNDVAKGQVNQARLLCSHLRLTVIQRCPGGSRFETGQPSGPRCWTRADTGRWGRLYYQTFEMIDKKNGNGNHHNTSEFLTD